MSEVGNCWGHSEREARESKIKKLLETPVQFVDESFKILIKKGSLSDRPEGARGCVRQLSGPEKDWEWWAAQHPCGGVQDDQPSKT